MNFRTIGASALAMVGAVLIAPGSTSAQQQGAPQAQQMTPQASSALSEQETRSFLDRVEQSVATAVNAQDYAQLIEWMDEYVSDGASFFVSEEIVVGDDRKSFSVATLNKNDMMRLGRIAVGFLSGMPGQSLENYSLDIEVSDVTQVAPGAVTTTARITETASIPVPASRTSGETAPGGQAQPPADPADQQAPAGQAQPEADAAGQQPPTGSFQIASEAQCNMLIRRDGGSDRLMIGMTNCQARTRL